MKMNDSGNIFTQFFAWVGTLAAALGFTTQDVIYMLFGAVGLLISLASYINGRIDRNIKVPLTEPQKVGIASFCPYNIGPGKCYPSTFYKRMNAGDTKGACEAIRWWIKDGGRDCRLTKGQTNGCYGQVERRDQESALTCWGIDQ